MGPNDVIDVTERASRRDPGTLRILLVDDEPVSLAALQAALNQGEIAIVGSTDSGEHALDLARILDPDIALIRWSLPRFGGALTARLMQWHAPNVTPVLLVDAEDRDELGDDEPEIVSIMRPVSRSELRATLRRIDRTAGRGHVRHP